MPATAPTWTDERVEILKSHFEAGLSCREIAADIGVSRNAVIGKLTRLNLTRRNSDEPRRPRKKRATSALGLKPTPREQYVLLEAIYARPQQPAIPDEPIDEAQRCSLLELGDKRCRWPIGTPGVDGFCFCGNAPFEGLPYCPGHSRLAYRPYSR
jgi:GcrA cell cycle regulator